MPTKNLVPRADGEGGIGTALKKWADGWFGSLNGKNLTGDVATIPEVVEKSLLTTTGDLIYASAANTPARLGVGSSGQVITPVGGVPVWGQLSHASLDGVGTNTHAQIDTFISTKSAASGLASLDANSLVAQNPANATTTPTPDKIPIASALGKLTGWVDAATTSSAGIVTLATTAITQAGADATTAVTPAGLAASAKGLISASTTIYVATSGSDTTGTGLVGAPFASIAKALSSIANKLIASGVTVTIQVADGMYTVSSAITINHPDADKIQILGNTSAETTVAITAIDTTAKTFTVAGDYTGSIAVGDIIGLTGSSTSGLNGAYEVSGIIYNGTYTIITCASDTIASSVIGGGSIVVKPCNRCVISTIGNISCFYVRSILGSINGFKIVGSGGLSAVNVYLSSSLLSLTNIIAYGHTYAVISQSWAYAGIGVLCSKNCTYGIFAIEGSYVRFGASVTLIVDTATIGVRSESGSFVAAKSWFVYRNAGTNLSPAANTVGNGNSYISA